MTTDDKSRLEAIRYHKDRINDLMQGKSIEALAIEENREVKIQLSWGGPGDGFKLYYSREGDLSHGYYYFEDWFFYEEFALNENELAEVESAFGTNA